MSLQCSPGRFERKETHAWLDETFDEPMVLFDQVVEIFALSKFTRYGKNPCCLQFLESFGISCIFIDSDDTRSHSVGGPERFREKVLCSLGITSSAQEELQSIPLGVHRTVEIHPYSFDLDICFVNASRISGRLEVGPTAFLQLRGIVLHPAVDRCMIYLESSFSHEFF